MRLQAKIWLLCALCAAGTLGMAWMLAWTSARAVRLQHQSTAAYGQMLSALTLSDGVNRYVREAQALLLNGARADYDELELERARIRAALDELERLTREETLGGAPLGRQEEELARLRLLRGGFGVLDFQVQRALTTPGVDAGMLDRQVDGGFLPLIHELVQDEHEEAVRVLNEAEALALRARRLALWLPCALAVLLVGGVLFLLRPLASSVRRLVGGAEKIGQGDLGVQLPLNGTDELAAVTRAFNRMVHQLRDSTVSRATLEDILQSMTDALFVVEDDGRVRRVNGAACRLLGRAPQELVGQPLSALLEVRRGAELPGLEGSRVRCGAIDAHVQGACGEAVPVHVEGARSEQLGAAVLVARDMREARRLIAAEAAEAELRRSNQRLECMVRERTHELERANATLEERLSELHRIQDQLRLADRLASLGTLTAGIAHEINNPLAFLMSNLEYARGELKRAQGVERDTLEALGEAHEGAERIRTIVRGLKVFSRQDDETRRAVDVREVLDVASDMARNEVRHRARLTKEYGPVPRVWASEHRLGQVFLNLVVNAAQAIPEGDVEHHEVRLVTRTGALGEAIIEVHDTGGGIPPDVLPHIFDPFFTTKRVGEGMGLGLSICHGIVQALGGTISVEPGPGKGTLFRVSLPAASASAHQGAPAPVLLGLGGQRRARVLVVDDEPRVAQALRRLLEREHEVHVETDAHEALERFAAGEHFDLILCDVMMPQMSGMQFCEALERLRPDQRAAVVPMTGGAFTPAASAFLERQPHGYLEKPVDAALLRGLLARVTAERSAA